MSKNARYAWRLSLGGLLLGLLACAVYLLAVPLGFKYGEIQVGHGLEHEGRIAWDAAGVPHIRAQSLEDGYFLLGYSHARDRLWQMEFARRYAGGTLSEVFGAKTLPMDRFARTLGFRRTAEGIYANLDAPTRVLLQRYSDGINAYPNWPRRRCRWNSAWCATNGRGPGGRWTACPCTCSIPGP